MFSKMRRRILSHIEMISKYILIQGNKAIWQTHNLLQVYVLHIWALRIILLHVYHGNFSLSWGNFSHLFVFLLFSHVFWITLISLISFSFNFVKMKEKIISEKKPEGKVEIECGFFQKGRKKNACSEKTVTSKFQKFRICSTNQLKLLNHYFCPVILLSK